MPAPVAPDVLVNGNELAALREQGTSEPHFEEVTNASGRCAVGYMGDTDHLDPALFLEIADAPRLPMRYMASVAHYADPEGLLFTHLTASKLRSWIRRKAFPTASGPKIELRPSRIRCGS